MKANMIDVSDNNHTDNEVINWCEVARYGIKNVMIKASEGTDEVNPWLDRDTHGARAAGLNVGFYHYAQPTLASPPSDQAHHFLSAIENLPRNLGGCLDLEVSNGLSWNELSLFAEEFFTILKAGKVLIRSLYTNPSWLSALPRAPYGEQLWLASWTDQVPRRKMWAWQFGIGVVPGVPGSCDLDYLYTP